MFTITKNSGQLKVLVEVFIGVLISIISTNVLIIDK